MELRKYYKNITHIKAFIKTENIRSQRFFKKIGFSYSTNTKINGHDAQEWILNIGKVFYCC